MCPPVKACTLAKICHVARTMSCFMEERSVHTVPLPILPTPISFETNYAEHARARTPIVIDNGTSPSIGCINCQVEALQRISRINQLALWLGHI
jgi:hypothetical protein